MEGRLNNEQRCTVAGYAFWSGETGGRSHAVRARSKRGTARGKAGPESGACRRPD